MPTDDSGIIREGVKLVTDRVSDRLARAAREVRPARRALKERVTREDDLALGEVERAGAGGVPGGVVRDGLDGPRRHRLAVLDVAVRVEGGGVAHGGKAEHARLDTKLLVKGHVVLVYPNLTIGSLFHC